MRWDLIASPELQNWLQHRDEAGVYIQECRFAPFGSSGKSTRNYAASILNAVDEFGFDSEIVASNTDYIEWAGGVRRHEQARGDLGINNARLWRLDGPPIPRRDRQIRWTPLGVEFYTQIIQNNLVEGVQEALGPRDGPAWNTVERVLEEARCFQLLNAAYELQAYNYMRYYNTYLRLRPFIPPNYLPEINQQGRYDPEFSLADFFHLMEWMNVEINDYNPFIKLLDALENSDDELDFALDEEVLQELYDFNLYESNWTDSWIGDFRNKSTPILMWIHAMERMASENIAPRMVEIEEEIEGEPVEHIPVLGVVQDLTQNTTQLLPEGVQFNPPAVQVQEGENHGNGERRPGDIYFVIRFVGVEGNAPRLLPLAKVGAAWPNADNPDIQPSLLREVGARRETNFPLFDSEGRSIEHLTVARFRCSDTRGLEGATGLRGHLHDEGFPWVRMDVTRQRENILLFGELGQDMSQITNEYRNDRLEQALQAMRDHPNDGHWNNIDAFEIVRPDLLQEFEIEWDIPDEIVPWV